MLVGEHVGLVDKFIFEKRGAHGCSNSDYAFEVTTCCEGEACGRRWRDLDRNARPLASLHVATQYDGEPLKTDNADSHMVVQRGFRDRVPTTTDRG
jgi:hypothetical protein